MIGDKNCKFAKGFTLMEVLVALTILSIVITAATNFFYFSVRTQNKTENLQKISTTTRLIMERIVREAQENEIDYNAYEEGQINLPTDILILKDLEDKPIIFQASDSDCPDEISAPCLKISNDGFNWASLTPKGVRLKDLKFYITPNKNPFKFNLEPDILDYESNGQPYILIVLSLENTALIPADYTSLTLQTGVSSRIYKR